MTYQHNCGIVFLSHVHLGRLTKPLPPRWKVSFSVSFLVEFVSFNIFAQVPSTFQRAHCSPVFGNEDNEAVIRIISEGRSPNSRHVPALNVLT